MVYTEKRWMFALLSKDFILVKCGKIRFRIECSKSLSTSLRIYIFYPIFWRLFLCFFRNLCPYVWLVFKSGYIISNILFHRSKWDDPGSLGLHFLYRSSQAKKHQNCPKSTGGHAQRVPILVPLWFEGFRKRFGTQPFDLLSVQSHGHLAHRTPELAHRN